MRGITFGALVVAGMIGAAGPALAEVHQVGPGEEYAAIGEVPWESLAPGDEVRIHWRPEPYREKWVIAVHGTEEQPIVVSGVKGPGGERPVVDGRDATTRSELNFWSEQRGVVKIGGANTPSSVDASWIRIEGLEIRSGRAPYTFTGRDGLTAYSDNAAAIFIERGENIAIRDCVLHDSGNGLFSASGSSDVLVEGNHIHDNGVADSIYEHNNYTESDGIVFQFNRFGPLRDGCPGNNLKDRSAGTVIRYNWIEGGNRQLDLVDSHGFAQADAHVYGNVLVEPDGAGNSQIVHFGGDSGEPGNYRQGTLYFFHNTVVSRREGNTTLMRLSTDGQAADVRNNVLFATAGAGALAMLDQSGELALGGNWVEDGWVDSHGGLTGSITEMEPQVGAVAPGFVDASSDDFHLVADGECRDAAGPLAASLSAEHAVAFEFGSMPAGAPRADDGTPDIGAFEYAAIAPGGPDGGAPTGPDAGAGLDGGPGRGGGADDDTVTAGCGCRASGGSTAGGLFAVLLVALAFSRSRRASR